MIPMVGPEGTPYQVDSELEAEMDVLRGARRVEHSPPAPRASAPPQVQPRTEPAAVADGGQHDK